MVEIEYVEATSEMRGLVAEIWGEVGARHLHIEDGFSILAMCGEKAAGLISVYPRALPPPLSGVREAFIDMIDVVAEYRRRGVARRLIEMSISRAREQGLHQIGAWSSEDKAEAIPMWKELGFALCPGHDLSGRTGEWIRGYFVALQLA
ncbi:MAG: GNAT family N-acetyltransferase [Gemmatimonadetes bacterium]|nr:GNAT family N-acetyltransferase [Gemmatimonadota bacterium]